MKYKITVDTYSDDGTLASTATFRGGPREAAGHLRNAADQLDRARVEAGRGLTTNIRSSSDVVSPNAVSRIGFRPVVAETTEETR